VKQILTLERAGNKYVHAVHVSIEDGLIATETPVKFLPGDGGTAIGGRVVGQEPDGIVLYVAFESRIHAAQATEARLMIDRSFLLAQLANALDNLPSLPKLAKPLWQVGYVGGGIANTDSVEVANQLAQLNTPWTRFLWGPPGAGKTYGLSYLTRLLLHKEPNNRILLVAPSNLAVDVVMGQVVRQLEASPSLRHLISQRKVMRFGYPRKAQILERPELLGPTNLDDYTQEIRRLSERIAKAEREKASDAQLAILRSKLLEAQETLKQAVDEHVKQCQVVATTTTLAYLPSSPITQVKWDTVVVDEVTMVPPAVCVFLSSLAEQRLLLAGDPRQLGPVYEENYGPVGNDREYMGRDIFEAGKVSLNINGIHHILVNDSRLVRITSQRRSATGIWEKVKHLYPDVESLNNKCQPNVSANYLRFLGSQSSYLM
jgi:hypothetical protein